MSKKVKKSDQVLQDHARKGKRFIPPLIDKLGPMQHVHWIDELLPEFLWIGLLIKRYGLKEGIELCSLLSKESNAVVKPEKSQAFNQVSEYALVSPVYAVEIGHVIGKEKMDQILAPLSPLVNIYPECPLGNFFTDSWMKEHPLEIEAATESLKAVVELMLDRHEKFGMYVQTTAYYLGLISGKIKIFANLDCAHYDPNWILDYPDTENSLKLAGAVRNTINMGGIVTDPNSHAKWCKYFWNRGLEISSCEFWEGTPQ